MTQKNKNILLISGFIITLIIAYQLAFSKTIDIKQQVQILREKSTSFQELAAISVTLNQREKFFDSILIKNNVKNNTIQNNLLSFLNEESTAKKFSIVEFKEPHTITEDKIVVTSYQFMLQGNFISLLETINQLEQKYNFGNITHVSFDKKHDYRKRKDYLECFIIVENMISK